MNEKKVEFWDIYTKDREKTGELHQRGIEMKPGEYHLAVHVCILNSKNQLLIQQRQPFKKGWSNMWDLSVGGSAVAGDISAMAAEREIFEELGLKVDLSNTRPFFTMNFSDGFDDYYIIRMDVELSELTLQEEEVQKVRWADKEEVLKMQEQGIMIPYWFLDRIFEMRDGFDAHGNNRKEVQIVKATEKNLPSVFSMIEILGCTLPELDTPEKLAACKEELVRKIDQGTVICALKGNIVVGILSYSLENSSQTNLVVHPAYRGKGIARKMKEAIPLK